jgi:undecaprenyl-diphosphatase
MRFADVFMTCALVVLLAVVAVPVLFRLGGRPGRWSPPVRRTVWLGAVCASGLLLAQAIVVDLVADADGPTAADQAALDWSVAHRVGWGIWLGRALALLGGPPAMTVLAVLGVGLLLVRRLRPQAVVVAATALGAVALSNGFKQLYARSRPPPEVQVIHYLTNALPSGHALGSTVVAGVLAAVLVLQPEAGALSRSAAPAVAGVFAVAVGMSRIYLGAHWLTDVLVGWLLGAAWLAVGVTALVLLRRSGAPPSGSPEPAREPGVSPSAG